MPPETLALLDLGSNAVRCLLARVTPGAGFRVLEEERVQTRLGAGPPGVLSARAAAATVAAVRRFLRRARQGRAPRTVAIATSAVRDAANRERLLGPLRREGVEVEVLSGEEEARLGAAAALHSLPFRDGVVADLGGGSLQLTRVRDRRIAAPASLPLGAVRLTRQFLRHDPPAARELRALRRTVAERLLPVLPPGRPGEVLVGLGGTVRTLARMHQAGAGTGRAARPRHGMRLRQSDVVAVRERLEGRSVRERRRLPGLKAERADTILAGAIVIEAALTLGGYLTLVVCTRGVRDGVLWREALDGERGRQPSRPRGGRGGGAAPPPTWSTGGR
jgi:exopolyphosphatase/guanosine-5'-triphosphate,3'-diphosphate pyrophosphatase